MQELSAAHRAIEAAPGLYWAEVYWMDGSTPKGAAERSEVQSGVPHLGWGRCYVVERSEDSKSVILFSPFAFEGFAVSRSSFEYASLRPPSFGGEFRRDWHKNYLQQQWEEAVKMRWQRDFGTAAIVMKLLGMEVPLDVLPAGVEAKETGGKEADVLGLLKPVKRSGRRGQVLAFFLAVEGHRRSIHEALAEFGITRSNLLSQLYLLQKDHGIGYKIAGDAVSVTLPVDCTDPFEAAA